MSEGLGFWLAEDHLDFPIAHLFIKVSRDQTPSKVMVQSMSRDQGGDTRHHLCVVLLVTSKVQVLTMSKETAENQETETTGAGSQSVCHIQGKPHHGTPCPRPPKPCQSGSPLESGSLLWSRPLRLSLRRGCRAPVCGSRPFQAEGHQSSPEHGHGFQA